jgi:hypothetical protein
MPGSGLPKEIRRRLYALPTPGAAPSENAEISASVLQIHEATQGKGTWLLDRDKLMLPWLRNRLALVIRQRGDRHVCLADGRRLAVTAVKEVWLPEAPDQALLLVAP